MKARVGIATPTYGHMSSTALHPYALLCATAAAQGNLHAILHVSNTYLDAARNQLVDMALEADCTHVFFVDQDMVVPPTAIGQLLQRNDSIVGAFCVGRTGNHEPVAFMLDPFARLTKWNDDLTQVDGVGMAATLVDVEVFTKMAAHFGDRTWFHINPKPDGGVVGEDVNFAIRCKEMGIPAWLDATVQCGHIGELVFTAEHFIN